MSLLFSLRKKGVDISSVTSYLEFYNVGSINAQIHIGNGGIDALERYGKTLCHV